MFILLSILSSHGCYMCTHGHLHISSRGLLEASSHFAVHSHVSPILTRLCCGRTLGSGVQFSVEQDPERNTLIHDDLGTRSSSKWKPQYQEFAYNEKLRRCWNEASHCFQYYYNVASLQDWHSTDHGSHTLLQDDGHPLTRAGTGRAAQKQTIVNIGREHRDGCAKLSETIGRWTSLGTSHDERIITKEEREREKEKRQ